MQITNGLKYFLNNPGSGSFDIRERDYTAELGLVIEE
jgi:hypothetical protein